MRLMNIVLVLSLIFVAGHSAYAEVKDDKVYESQLQGYSGIYDELMGGMMAEKEKANEERKQKNQKIKMLEMQLEKEYDNLVSGVETKEDSIVRLRDLNTKLKSAQSEMWDQYSELEVLFKKQREENQRLKSNLENSKTEFYNKMVEFYEEEHQMLGEKLKTLQERYDEVEAKLEMMKANLEGISE